MNHRTQIESQNELEKLAYFQQVEKALSLKLGLPSIRGGNKTIRDEKRWRVNEKYIEYAWLIHISRSFAGWCWLFSIKFKENVFREITNEEELLQGIFTIDKNGDIHDFYFEKKEIGFKDEIKNMDLPDLYNVNSGITLDGVGYDYLVFSPNAALQMTLNNPNSKNWKEWEGRLWKLGLELSQKANLPDLKDIFIL